MNTIKTLLAVSVLAAAGAANATIVQTYTGTITGSTTAITDFGPPPVIQTIGVQETGGPVTASLNDNGDGTGVLTVDFTLHFTATAPAPLNLVDDILTGTAVFNGSYSGGTFSINDVGTLLIDSTPSQGLGQETFHTCGGTYCDAGLIISATGTAHPYDSFSTGTVNLSGGSIATQELAAGAYFYNKTFNLTAVPVPAAAWLFGSGLLGLAGTARRRRSV